MCRRARRHSPLRGPQPRDRCLRRGGAAPESDRGDHLGPRAGHRAGVRAHRDMGTHPGTTRAAARDHEDRAMKTLARVGAASVALTYLHLVFGGIVRITGSGMGCGDHWPKCLGSWIPPFDHPTILIEWTHRLLALLVVITIAALTLVARSKRDEPGVAGPGGVLRPAALALALVVGVALLGMVTVRLGNSTYATVA